MNALPVITAPDTVPPVIVEPVTVPLNVALPDAAFNVTVALPCVFRNTKPLSFSNMREFAVRNSLPTIDVPLIVEPDSISPHKATVPD